MDRDYLNDLDKLHALKEKGAIDDNEFQEAKRKLLEQGSAPLTTSGASVDRQTWVRNTGLVFRSYPEWVMALLSFLTLGYYTMFWLNHWHGVMAKRRGDDPTTARAIWCLFIPFFGLYWVFESLLRLSTRLDEELSDAGVRDRVPKELVRWYCIFSVIPYVNWFVNPFLGTIATFRLQSLVNLLARYDEPYEAARPLGPLPSQRAT